MEINEASTLDIPRLTSDFYQKDFFLDLMLENEYCHDAKSARTAKDLFFSNECTSLNISLYEDYNPCLAVSFEGTNS